MKVIKTLFFVLCLAVELSAQFELRIISVSDSVQKYGAVVIDYELKNTGGNRQISIGIAELNTYIFVRYNLSGEEAKFWRDISLPEALTTEAPKELFEGGSVRTGSVEIFWQPDIPVFAEEGSYEILVLWTSPDGNILSDPVIVDVVAPSGDDLSALQILVDNGALPSLTPQYWEFIQSPVFADFYSPTVETFAGNVLNNYPNSYYAERINKAQQIASQR